MRINGHGKARVLKPDEILRLFSQGLKCARDRAIFGLCLYTACRIAEARQMHYVDAFAKETVRRTITIRKINTKGKLDTRTIATHPKLAEILERYRLESLELLRLRETYGNWHYASSHGGARAICPRCGSLKTHRNGSKGGIQRYKCLQCNSHFKELIELDEQRSVRMSKDSFAVLPHLDNSFPEPMTAQLTAPGCHDDQLLTVPSSPSPEALSFTYPLLEKILIPQFNHLGIDHSDSYGFLFSNPENQFLFPGRGSQGCITDIVIRTAFNEACERVGIEGAGTHSLRRTTMTTLHRQKVPLKVIQAISGHKRLASLQEYLEVEEDEVDAAIDSLD